MKIGILTFQFAHNYGAVLQSYALKETLRKMGNDVEIINYYPDVFRYDYSINPLVNSRNRLEFIKNTLKIPLRFKQYNLFRNFQQEKLALSKPLKNEEELIINIKSYDAIICGSDQIWNNEITGNTLAYYADYEINNVKRVAYAASFGTDKITLYQIERIQSSLKKFDKISVRESRGIEYIKKYMNSEVKIVVDPVFLLENREWLNLSDTAYCCSPKRYILYYALRHDNELIKFTENLSKNEQLPIIAIHPTCLKQKLDCRQLYNVGPMQFIRLIEDADYVCTNSFHATAFSMIFQKKLLYVPYAGMANRVESLFSLAGVDKGKYNSSIIDFREINKSLLQDLIEESKLFLLNL